MWDIAPVIVSMADASLGGLQGRSALLIGPKEGRALYAQLLRQEAMKEINEEDTPERIIYLLPYVQLLINMPGPGHVTTPTHHAQPESAQMLTAAQIARGCTGRMRPLVIFDLAQHTSVEELAGLLPPVCLYTPEDIRHILHKSAAKAS